MRSAPRTRPHRSRRRGVWRRALERRDARASLAVLVLLTGVSIVSLPVSLRWWNVQSLHEAIRHPPSLEPVAPPELYLGRSAIVAPNPRRDTLPPHTGTHRSASDSNRAATVRERSSQTNTVQRPNAPDTSIGNEVSPGVFSETVDGPFPTRGYTEDRSIARAEARGSDCENEKGSEARRGSEHENDIGSEVGGPAHENRPGVERESTSGGSLPLRWAYRLSSLLGHDDLGRSLLYRLLPGFLISLGIGLAAVAVAVGVGVLWGASAALVGGRIDLLMMRIVDVLFGLPYVLMVILLKVALTPVLTAMLGARAANLVVLFVAIGGVSWLTMARVVRGQVLSLREQGFVEAARAAGASHAYILRRHLLPNLTGPVLTCAALILPQAVLQESFLSFLGIGVQPPVPSLGLLAAEGVEAVNTFVGFWWLIVFPCGMLVVTLMALNILGDALRDAAETRTPWTPTA